MRQGNIEADGLGAGIERALRFAASMMPGPPPVMTTAVLVLAVVAVGFADDPSEFAGDVVIAALGKDVLCGGEAVLQLFVAGVCCEGLFQIFHLTGCLRTLADTGAPENHDGLAYPCFPQEEVRLEIVDLEAKAAQVVPGEEVEVGIRPAVARTVEDRFNPGVGLGIFLGGFRSIPGEGLAPLKPPGSFQES